MIVIRILASGSYNFERLTLSLYTPYPPAKAYPTPADFEGVEESPESTLEAILELTRLVSGPFLAVLAASLTSFHFGQLGCYDIALEQQWYEDLKPPRTATPTNDLEDWNFNAPTRPLKPYMPAEVCEAMRLYALLFEKHAPASPDPDRMKLEAGFIRAMAKFTRGYAGLRPWNTWDWKPAVSNFPHGKPW